MNHIFENSKKIKNKSKSMLIARDRLLTAKKSHPILELHHKVGNKAVQRMLQSGAIQTSLKIGQSDDKYEQEANKIAERITQIKSPFEYEKDKKKRKMTLQRKEIPNNTSEVTPELASKIQAMRNGGQPLPASIRDFFESRFGYSFDHVSIHNNSQAAESARAINARAYTIGRNIFFERGQYMPETIKGKRILAHELTHVIQQGAAHPKQEQRKYTWGVQTETDLWRKDTNSQNNFFASKGTNEYYTLSSFNECIVQFQKGTSVKNWTPCEMPGKRDNLDPGFLGKLDNICGRMKAQGYPTHIYWGHRTLKQQVEIATRGRTFNEFKTFMNGQVKRGNITSKESQAWIDYYDPNVGKHPMEGGFKGPVTWTLKSTHLTGKAADVAHPTEGWAPKAGAKYWDALKVAAQAEGLQIGPPARDRAHVEQP